MSEPYYRISTAKSELEDILYDQGRLGYRLYQESMALRARRIRDGVPTIASIKATHRFPFRVKFKPVVNSANQFLLHDNATNRRFTIEYAGEYAGRMYQAVDFTAGTVAAVNGADNVYFAYCQNFIASLLNLATYKVSTDILYEFPGPMLFAWYNLLAPYGSRPALLRSLRESCWEFKWMAGTQANTATDGTGNRSLTSSLTMHHPYNPIQAYAETHPAFTVYIPYNIFTLCNVGSAYPIVSVYSLQRTLEYSFKDVRSCINVWADDGTWGNGGLIAYNESTALTWSAVPTINATRLLVEYWVVHKDLQHMLAMNAHGFLIRQYFHDTETLTDKTVREISVTKIIESIYFIARHSYNVTVTPVNPGVDQVTLTAVTIDRVYEIDPFSLPQGQKPINNITLGARGQSFYKNLDWDEISSVYGFLFENGKCGTSLNHCLGAITFAHFYIGDGHTGSYNSGFGPNLRLSWTQHAFSQSDPGILDSIIQGLNMVLTYRGALTIRYT